MTAEVIRTFDQWIDDIFDRPVEDPYQASYRRRWLEQSPAVALEYVARLFENPCGYLSGYSDEQIGQGIYIVVSQSCSDHFSFIAGGDVDLALRKRCIRSLENLSRELFAPRCSENVWIYTKPLNQTCDLLWDLVVYGTNSTDWNSDGVRWGVRNPEIDEEVLDTLSRIVAIPNVACQQSALHGLGHLVDFAGLGSTVIQRYLDDNPDLRDDLRRYAENALLGRVM
jgi:hypothetical protein